MRALLQRVTSATVSVEGETVASICAGLVVFLGIESADTPADAEWLAGRIASLRLFSAGEVSWGRRSLETGGESCSSRNSPCTRARAKAPSPRGTGPLARRSRFRSTRPDRPPRARLGKPVATGRFGAMMQVALVNDGPVTVLIDSKARE